MGPYQVIKQTKGRSYILEEMDSSELAEHVAAYRLIPYVRRQNLDQLVDVLINNDDERGEVPQEPSDEEQQSSGSES